MPTLASSKIQNLPPARAAEGLLFVRLDFEEHPIWSVMISANRLALSDISFIWPSPKRLLAEIWKLRLSSRARYGPKLLLVMDLGL